MREEVANGWWDGAVLEEFQAPLSEARHNAMYLVGNVGAQSCSASL
jgi:hypothetical protein